MSEELKECRKGINKWEVVVRCQYCKYFIPHENSCAHFSYSDGVVYAPMYVEPDGFLFVGQVVLNG